MAGGEHCTAESSARLLMLSQRAAAVRVSMRSRKSGAPTALVASVIGILIPDVRYCVNDEGIEMSIFAENLRIAIDAKGLTQDRLANLSGVSQASISTWLRSVTLPRSEELQRVAVALGVSMDWLMSGAVVGGRSSGCQRCAELQSELYALRVELLRLAKADSLQDRQPRNRQRNEETETS